MYKQETDWLKKWAIYNPNKMFLRDHEKDTKWNYFTFNQKSETLAYKLLNELKLVKGDRICVYSKNSAEYVLLFTACIKTGIILVPLNFRLTPRELDILIRDASPILFLYENEYTEDIKKLHSLSKVKLINSTEVITNILYGNEDSSKSIIADIDIEDPVMILYTAGTTGLSKGAIINHRMLFWNAVNTCLRLDITSNDHTQSYAPFFHTGGWNVLFTPFLFHGASHTLLQKFDSDTILQLMEKEKTTILFGVPTMLR